MKYLRSKRCACIRSGIIIKKPSSPELQPHLRHSARHFLVAVVIAHHCLHAGELSDIRGEMSNAEFSTRISLTDRVVSNRRTILPFPSGGRRPKRGQFTCADTRPQILLRRVKAVPVPSHRRSQGKKHPKTGV